MSAGFRILSHEKFANHGLSLDHLGLDLACRRLVPIGFREITLTLDDLEGQALFE